MAGLTIKQEKFCQGLFSGLTQREAYKQAFKTDNMADKTIDEAACKLANVKESAEAERDYRAALAKEILKLKTEGMSVTLISDIARGNTSDLKFKRDLAEAQYTSGRDSLKAIMAQVNALQTIVKYVSEV
jgi:hypothetical protein